MAWWWSAEPFHRAIDIPSRGGTSVFALNSGIVTYRENTFTGWICCFKENNTGANWWYFHLKDEPVLNQYYNEGDKINEIYDKIDPYPGGFDDHLHLLFGDRYYPSDNPLLQFPEGSIYRDPPDGTIWPWVWTPTLIEERAAIKSIHGKLWWLYPFWADKPIPKIYDYVDILAKAQDFMGGTLANSSEVNTGVYKLGFYISTKDKRPVFGEKVSPIIMHEFTGPLPAGDKFDAFFSKENPSSNWHDFFYIVTNIEGDTTKCWATKAMSGGFSETDPRARIHSEAVYPDGDYIIWLMSWDATGNAFGDGEATYVCLDNFRPYVQQVQIGQEEKVVKYQAHWSEAPVSNTDLGKLIIDVDNYCKAGLGLTFVVVFSEDMNTTVSPLLRVVFPNGNIKTVTGIGSWLDKRTYRIITGNDFIPSGTSGRATLSLYKLDNLRIFENSGIGMNYNLDIIQVLEFEKFQCLIMKWLGNIMKNFIIEKIANQRFVHYD